MAAPTAPRPDCPYSTCKEPTPVFSYQCPLVGFLFIVSCGHEARHKPRLCKTYFGMPLRLRMKLDVPAADDPPGPDLGHRTGHRDTEHVARAGLAMVFHRYGERACRSASVAGPREQDPLR